MKIARKIVAFGALLCALTVGFTEAASAAPPIPVPPKSVEKMPPPSVSPALASCNGATSFWYVYPYLTVALPTFNGDPDCIMGSGNQGMGVYWLQASLINCHGLNTGGQDGVYGPSTRAAVIAVQRAAGIPADGVYGPQTRQLISWMLFRDFRWEGCGRL